MPSPTGESAVILIQWISQETIGVRREGEVRCLAKFQRGEERKALAFAKRQAGKDEEVKNLLLN